ncbi:MAG: cephalosporin hydroxylase family protein [Sandaracinaceae bacterium]|nr:cephalosporin hydroxylase family protein [Sandaracinaceae bacterium]
MSDPIKEFELERAEAIAAMAKDEELKQKSLEWMLHADKYKYTYNYRWLGRPIIKFPSDILLMQELLWDVKPDLVIETGIAHGGSIIFSASMLELLGGEGEVLAIDIDIRKHNRAEIEKHPMSKRIRMIEGSSVSEETMAKVREAASKKKNVMVFLDSLHTHDHVLRELELYAPLVSVGSYLVLPDTFIEYFPRGYYSANRPWDVGNNPMTALRAWLPQHPEFEIDHARMDKLMITEAFDGYLRRVR